MFFGDMLAKVVFVAGPAAVLAEIRSLTRIDCAPELFCIPPMLTAIGFGEPFIVILGAPPTETVPVDMLPEEVLVNAELVGIAPAGAAAAGAAGLFASPTFFRVSSTSAAAQPTPTSAALIASRETPAFICDEIYSTS
jgi:hypothetical protein